jgi:hypothetical protein
VPVSKVSPSSVPIPAKSLLEIQQEQLRELQQQQQKSHQPSSKRGGKAGRGRGGKEGWSSPAAKTQPAVPQSPPSHVPIPVKSFKEIQQEEEVLLQKRRKAAKVKDVRDIMAEEQLLRETMEMYKDADPEVREMVLQNLRELF